MMRALLLGCLLFLGACATTPVARPDPSGDSLDAVARDYVALILEIGEREPGYVDAYYGPPEWAEAARANPRDVPALIQGAASLTERLNAISVAGAEPTVAQRKAYLLAHVSAAAARLRMIGGERMSFADEAEALFGVRPELRPLSDFDPILAEIDRLVPGVGELATRVAAFRGGFQIPTDRLQAVFDASIAECRARTIRHIDLPANERFTLAFVTDKPWSGYNYYLGGAASRIEINTDQPIFTDRAIDLGCHEAYPGHHVYNALLEQTFVVERGWVEMSVYPLYSPMSFVAEGSANYGIDLAFPGDEAARFERDVLLPLAGLTGAPVQQKAQLNALVRRLARAEYTIADDYLAGRIDRAEATRLLSRYMLTTPERAAQRVRFIDTYRSYIINYGLGRDVVQAWIERQGTDRWQAMETLLSSQILPVDLL
ncbi:hypothetical protein IP78_02675 [Brevundimonas sp. AAP58]|nr:hypothetical protein IP78_02675 [Brevundimonas sp. AAP58]